jgi:hypothetical protein
MSSSKQQKFHVIIATPRRPAPSSPEQFSRFFFAEITLHDVMIVSKKLLWCTG